jgi:hypothetical protein
MKQVFYMQSMSKEAIFVNGNGAFDLIRFLTQVHGFSGQLCLLSVPEEIEQTAQRYAKKIICRLGQRTPVPVHEQNNQPDIRMKE